MHAGMSAGQLQLSGPRSSEDILHNNADETLRRAVRWSTDIVALYLHWHGFIRGSLSLQLESWNLNILH